tara:strand:+ start:430 stop:696 length:267 start_codon:yes stop_codon:yes gene_type:complete
MKINTKRFADVEFEDERLVESIERVMTAVELLEARGRTGVKDRAKINRLEEENTELIRKINKLQEFINTYLAESHEIYNINRQKLQEI